MLKKIIHTLTLLVFLSGLLVASPPTPAYAATLTVTTLTDENDGSCLDGDCSLRDAIQVAADNDTITFSVTGTIVLNSVLTVDKSLTITGPGSSQLTLDGNDQHRIFNLVYETPTNTINISRMTMTKGYADPTVVCGGGAINSNAFLTMDDVVITDNHAPADVGNCVYPRGGGILFFNGSGSLTMTNSTVSNNSTYYGGGGIYFSSYNGNISLDNVNVDGNQTTDSNGGGVSIENALATVTITDSIISNNDAIGSSAAGGGLYLRDATPIPTTNIPNATLMTVTIENTYISLNTAANQGGGIYNFLPVINLTNSTIADNSAFNNGGGLYNYNSTVTINTSTIKGNTVTGGSTSYGGGIYNVGLEGTGAMTIVNSTLTGNSSSFGKGGALYNQASGTDPNPPGIATINIYNSTIVSNSAYGSYGGGGIFVSTATGNEVSTVTLSNSIVYGNTLTGSGTNGENCRIINSGTIVANNHNLFQNLVSDCVAGASDVTSNLARPSVVLGLTSNGGTTQTMALPTGSPAIDAGSNAICAAAPVNNASQNDIIRPAGSACDIGSFEKSNIAITIGGVKRGNYNLTQGSSQRVNYAGLDSGPVVVESTDNTNLIAALRDAYFVNGQLESFVQLMGLPQESLSTTYYFPAYNNVTLDGQLRFGNVGVAPTTVTVTIAGVVRGTYPLNPGEATRVNYTGLDSGPVVVSSSGGVPIIAALRDAYYVDGRLESFAQLMGLPAEKLSTKYYFPAYNNVTLNGQLRIGNVGNSATTVTVTIAGVLRGTYPLNPSEAVRINYAGLDAGPVVVESSGGIPIIAALRDAYFVSGKLVSFVQLMGLPQEQLSTNYNFPAYNNVTLDGQLRFGNVGIAPTTVTVTIGGVVRGTYPLNPSEAVRVNYAGLDAGPVVVSSSGGVPIIAALRDAYFVNGVIESFAQLMGLPLEQLSTGYYFPAYNNVTLDGQLRFGMP